MKNEDLGFAIPYYHIGQVHDYVTDFIVRLDSDSSEFLILETKGYDPLTHVKKAAAERWMSAVNSKGTFGRWQYAIARKPEDISKLMTRLAHGFPPKSKFPAD